MTGQRVALLSTDDKTDIGVVAANLHAAGFLILASTGTREKIAASGTAVTDTAEWTGFPPILHHRLVTMSPQVGGGLLANMADADDVADMADHGLRQIHFVYFGLYDFAARLAAVGETWENILESMDVGGPAALCAAAKGARIVVTNPEEALSVSQMVLGGEEPQGRMLQVLQRNAVAASVAHQSLVLAAMNRWLDAQDDASAAAWLRSLTEEQST